MKRIMISAMVLVILLVSIGGCFVPWHGDGGMEEGEEMTEMEDMTEMEIMTETEVMIETEAGVRKEMQASR